MATPSTPTLKWIALILLGFGAAIFLARITPLITGGEASYDEQRSVVRLKNLAEVQAAEEKALTSTEWVDADKQIIKLPLEEVLDKTVEALKAKPVQVGTALPNVQPPSAPAPAPAQPQAPAPAPPTK